MADNDSRDGFAAFILGGIVGGALGLLLAPRKGEETRELLADWLEESRQKTEAFLEEERTLLTEKKDRIEAAWDAGKKAYKKPTNGKGKHSH